MWWRPSVCAIAVATVAACRGAAPESEQAGSAHAAARSTATSSTPALAGSATPSTPTLKHYTTTALPLGAPDIALPQQESFKLLAPGDAPRAPLRYQLAAGTANYIAETTLTSRHLENGAFSKPTQLPTIRDGFAITIADAAPTRLALRGLRAELAAPSADADAYLARWRAGLQDRRITLSLDARGAVSAITFNDDPKNTRSAVAHDELVQRLLSLAVPLPAEPVGIGARWQVVTILRQGPAYAKQTATYTLAARDQARWKLHLKLQRVAEEQRLDDPALPAGTTADLLAMFRLLEGDIELSPTRPLVIAGVLAFESRLHVRLMPPSAPASATSEQIFEDTGTIRIIPP